MLKTRVIPCLLLQDDLLYKTVRFGDPKYVGDPINAVKIFNEKEVDELVFLDISATAAGRPPNLRLISDIASEAFMPFAYGGGIRTLDQAKALFGVGVEKVVLNSYAFENPKFVSELARLFGSQSVVISVDCRKKLLGRYEAFTRNGKAGQKLDPVAAAVRMQEAGAGEILLMSIDLDGTMEGYDLQLIQKVSSALTIPLVASGGAGQVTHFAEAVKAGASAVAAGSMFVFHGRHRAVLITYPTRAELERAFQA